MVKNVAITWEINLWTRATIEGFKSEKGKSIADNFEGKRKVSQTLEVNQYLNPSNEINNINPYK